MTRTAIISGGTKGIGRASAFQLLEDGFNVVTFSTTKEHCEVLEAELAKQFEKGRFLVLQGDVVDEKSMKKVVGETIKKFNSIDVLFNNAGFGYFADTGSVDMDRFQRMINVNIYGVALLTNLVVPYMKKQKSGLILNMGSIAGKIASARSEYYALTKFAVLGYSDGLRKELMEFGIKVSTLCPGMVDTDFFYDEELEFRKQKLGKVPHMLKAEDISKAVSFICSQPKHCNIQDLTIMPFD